MDDWNEIRLVLAIQRAGSLTAAAKALGVDHSTAFRRLNALEARLGVRLFERLHGGIYQPTPAGQRMAAAAERMEDEALALGRDITGGDHRLSGRLRITSSETLAYRVLPRHLALFRQAHPGIVVELIIDNRVLSLSRREADIAIALAHPEEGRLIARKLTDYTLGLYAAKSYLERAGTPASLDDLKGHVRVGYVDDLLFSSSLNFARELVKDWRADIEISSAIGQTEAVRAGAGIGILHTFIARRDENLVPLLPDYSITRSYWTVVHEDLSAIRRVSVVADFIAAEVARERAIFCA